MNEKAAEAVSSLALGLPSFAHWSYFLRRMSYLSYPPVEQSKFQANPIQSPEMTFKVDASLCCFLVVSFLPFTAYEHIVFCLVH